VPAENFSAKLGDSIDGLRIGVPAEFFGEGLAARCARGHRCCAEGIRKARRQAGAHLLPRTELSIPVYYIIAPAEASSNLSRFDGVKFGHRAKDYRT
jgi:aspartyl-tRNA(Asn)/glutamyl-tRNA(Gln) amidotransferase subunit A